MRCRLAVTPVLDAAPEVQWHVEGKQDQTDPVEPAEASADGIVRRVIAADRPQQQASDAEDDRDRTHDGRHLDRARVVVALEAKDAEADHRHRQGEQVAHVGEHVDLQRRAHEQHQQRRDQREDDRRAGRAVLVRLAEDRGQHAVDGVLPQATRRADQRVEHGQEQRCDEGQPDEPLPELARAEDLVDVAEEHDVGIAERVEAGESGRAEDGEQHQWQGDVDEQAEEPFGRHRDLGVARGLAALADVAGRCFHRPDRPREDEGPADDQLPRPGHAVRERRQLHAAEVDRRRMKKR